MLQVACALIEHAGRVLICQRSERMRLPGKWEFPGGKVEAGETLAECLKREILEELRLEIAVGRALRPVVHRDPDFSLQLYPFICRWVGGVLLAREHARAVWVYRHELTGYDWAEADLPVVREYINLK